MSYATVQTKFRDLVQDFSKSMLDIFSYTVSAVFTLTEENPITVSDVSVNDSSLSASDYSYDSTTRKVTITSSLSSGDSIKITYTYYSKYSATESQGYIKSALTHISINNYADWKVVASEIYPEPSTKEDNLIAAIAAIIAEPGNRTVRMPDVSVIVPKDLPTNVKIKQIINAFKRSSHGVFSVL